MDILRRVIHLKQYTSYNVFNNDFFIDRLCHRHTNSLILIFTCLATYKRLASHPISCWIPAELHRYEKFMNLYCWLKGTYYVKDNYRLENITFAERNETLLRYYQWIPFILLLQAFLFYLPRILWSFISDKVLGYNLFEIISASIKCDSYDANRKRLLQYLNGLLTQTFHNNSVTLEKQKQNDTIKASIFSYQHYEDTNVEKRPDYMEDDKNILAKATHKLKTSSLLLTYCGIKFLYFTVALIQLLLMNAYLSNKQHSFYGTHILSKIYNGTDQVNGVYMDSRIFPRITSCDVTMRELGKK
jgi:hypothetical protein